MLMQQDLEDNKKKYSAADQAVANQEGAGESDGDDKLSDCSEHVLMQNRGRAERD